MEHKIIEKDEFRVIGIPVVVTMNDPGYKEKIKDIWTKFIPRLEEIKNRLGSDFYGTCNMSKGIPKDDCSFETIAGVKVAADFEVPEGMKSQVVPKAKYFVVTHKGRADQVGDTWQAVMDEMKKLNMIEDTDKIFFELYDERFKEDSDESEIDLYSPIK